MAALTIRNVTSIPLTLKVVERFHGPKKEESAAAGFLSNVTQNVTDFVTNSTSTPSNPAIPENAKSFVHKEKDIRVEPFKIAKTDVKAHEESASEIMRLVFAAPNGNKYRMDCPPAGSSSHIMTPLQQGSAHEFTGCFIRDDTFLAIFDSSDLHCWMKHHKDRIPLSALSICGTHNSPTHHPALPSVRCQAVSPIEQLNNGVRFFDLRVQVGDPPEDVNLVHSVFPISLTGTKKLKDLLQDIYKWLEQNPSETLIVSLKREGTGNATDQMLGKTIRDHFVKGHEQKWYTLPKIPTLGEARGKIVLLRRFCINDEMHKTNDGKGFALNCESWADNTAHDTHGCVCVQDFYELNLDNVGKKATFAQEQLARAATCVCHIPGVTTDKVNPVPPQPFYLNFLSGSNFWQPGVWPDKVAEKLNPQIVRWLCEKHAVEGLGHQVGDGSTGIVVTDWVGQNGNWDIVRCIIGMNAILGAKEARG